MVKTENLEKQTFDRIVLPVDGSDSSAKAVKKSLYLSKKTTIPIMAIYVIDMNIYSKTLTSDQVSEQWKSILSNEGNSILNEIKGQAENEGINIKTVILEGSPSEEIINESNKNDLIIMGIKGKSAIDRILIGSVSENVLHHSESTVMLVR
jgi:nucleotide-binding universal stress UspA family protein